MDKILLRSMGHNDWNDVTELIYSGTNHWYQSHGMGPIFPGKVDSARIFCEVYEALDPGCCILATDEKSKQIIGSCFYHPRPTHVSLGIMNVHLDHFGEGIGRRLLQFIVDFAESESKPIRLVSSALNLDSFSLYTLGGFKPYAAYQDLVINVPDSGLDFDVSGTEKVRPATLSDVPPMEKLEMELNHISREKDFRHFVKNDSGIWNVSVYENEAGELDGFLASVQHPGSNMLGPGVARTNKVAAALIYSQLNQHCGRSPVFLIPVTETNLWHTLKSWGARICEIHFGQVRGEYTVSSGIVMPTFMPETA